MNKTLILTKILLKNGSGSIKNASKKKLNRATLIVLIIVLACVPLILTIINLVSTLFDVMKSINQQGVIIALALPAVVIIIFLFGIAYIINTFYFSTDIENLLPLPLKSTEILGAKFATVLVYEYITEAVILIPVFSVYAIKNSETFLFYLYSIFVLLILPIIPLVAASVIDMIIMRFTNIAKNKDAFRIFGGIFAMFIAISINIFVQRFAVKLADQSMVMELLSQGNNSLISITSSLFPSTEYAVYGLVNSNTINGLYKLLIFTFITVAAYFLFIALGKLLYFEGVVGVSETASKRRSLTNKEIGKSTKMNTIIYSYALKELKLLMRTPVYFINCIMMSFLWPVFLVIPMLAKPKSAGNFDRLIPYVQVSSSTIIIAVALACGIFITASNMITSTAISREGKNLFFMKYIPVDYRKQILGKVISGAVMGFVGMLMLAPVAFIFLKIKPYIVVFSILISIFGILFSALFGILLDIIMPKLNWDTEQKAVKQNFNGTISFLASFALGGLLIFLSIKLPFSSMIVSPIFIFIFVLLDWILYKLVMDYGAKRIESIDC